MNDGVGEFRSSPQVRTALVDGETFKGRAIEYAEVDGLAIVEGDIVLGSVEEVEQQTRSYRSAAGDAARGRRSGVIVTGQSFRWPNCTVPYEIDSGLASPQRVRDAIAHWETNTDFRFVQRTEQNRSQYPDFVRFVPGSGCSSMVGRRGGQQNITLTAACTTGNTIHEIGHAVGMWHEQSREDRDAFAIIHWQNIVPGREHNFNQHIQDGDDVGAYDYDSIMHYPRNAFSRNGQDTIEPVDPGAQIGQRNGLSAGDIATAAALCGRRPTLKFVDDRPPGPTLKFRDDPRPTAKFIDDPRPTLKFADDPRPTLKFRDDPRPTVKFLDDRPPTIKFADDRPPGPTAKFIDDRAPAPGGRGGAPFVLATPHHSMAWTATFPEAHSAQVAEIEARLAELESQLGEMADADARGLLPTEQRAEMEALDEEYRALLEEHETVSRG